MKFGRQSSRPGPLDPQYWSAQIGYGIKLRARAVELLPDEYPELIAPQVGAEEADLDAVSSRLGRPLDAQYRAFLTQANGWPDFFMSGDLLSTAQLFASPAMDVARVTLQALYEPPAPPPTDLPDPISISVVLASIHNPDLIVIDYSGSLTDGGHPVLWLGDEVVDAFANFDEFFRSANQYLRNEIDLAGGLPDGYHPVLGNPRPR